ncbi:hypothetical protein [Neptunomonas phycophila]|uniref:hypothetical protein n=1 Tax=Neptunomonas phycophila TaxID=1572645 RepID=UPI00094915A8|nr:hypothetical protein [Neptunomonas phycophila]
MFKKALLIASLLPGLVTSAIADSRDEVLIIDPNGVLTYTPTTEDSLGKLALNGRVLDVDVYWPPEVESLGTNGYDNFYALSLPTGGSACLEKISVIKVNDDGYHFSQLMSACGGVRKYTLSDEEYAVIVDAIERDEETRVRYKVDQWDLKISVTNYSDYQGTELIGY